MVFQTFSPGLALLLHNISTKSFRRQIVIDETKICIKISLSSHRRPILWSCCSSMGGFDYFCYKQNLAPERFESFRTISDRNFYSRVSIKCFCRSRNSLHAQGTSLKQNIFWDRYDGIAWENAIWGQVCLPYNSDKSVRINEKRIFRRDSFLVGKIKIERCQKTFMSWNFDQSFSFVIRGYKTKRLLMWNCNNDSNQDDTYRYTVYKF